MYLANNLAISPFIGMYHSINMFSKSLLSFISCPQPKVKYINYFATKYVSLGFHFPVFNILEVLISDRTPSLLAWYFVVSKRVYVVNYNASNLLLLLSRKPTVMHLYEWYRCNSLNKECACKMWSQNWSLLCDSRESSFSAYRQAWFFGRQFYLL